MKSNNQPKRAVPAANTPHIAAKSTKRRHNPAFKRKLVELTQQAGASVAAPGFKFY